MSRRTWPPTADLPHLSLGQGEATTGVAYYRTDHELTFYLRAFQRFRGGRLVVVLALQDRKDLLPAEMPPRVRIILTAHANTIDADEAVGFIPDPLKAVVLAMAGLDPNDGLILLFPSTWRGESPDTLVEMARCKLSALTGHRVVSECE